MKINIGDYLIETDERQFVVKINKTVTDKESKNYGQPYVQNLAYCTTLNSALKQIEVDIDSLPKPIKIEVEKIVVKKEKVEEDSITISKEEYEQLLGKEKLLDCLEAAGVDNWGGWDDAMEMMNTESL